MTRKLRRNGIFAVLYIATLCLIIYLGQPASSSDKSFAWTKVRYPSRPLDSSLSTTSHAVCPGLAASTKPALVVASTPHEDTSWTSALADKYHLCIYVVDTGSSDTSSGEVRPPVRAITTIPRIRLPSNRAHESLPYLEFIIANYNHLPTAGLVFVHGSRFAWHNDHRTWDNLPLLQDLNISSALQAHGYHNLRCDWSVGTCGKAAKPQGSFIGKVNAALEPHKARLKSDIALAGAFQALFGGDDDNPTLTSVTLGGWDIVRSQCCAQFVVARENILQHTSQEYEGVRAWLLDGMRRKESSSKLVSQMSMPASDPDDRIAGRVISYIWHILFLPRPDHATALDLNHLNQRACPSARECYCRLYGKCELEGCDEGRCRGQYGVPRGYKLPDNWAELHG